MATYLKRTSKLFDLSLIRSTADVNLRDLICPVCRGILIEPVTLPCTHNLCLRCLKGTFEHNSLSCPLCRVRVGSWLRTATKSETLVNNALWELIRTRFPKEVEGKRNGDEGDIELDSGFTSKKIILSAAGEIRREYEAQLQIAEEEIRRQREAERLANEALIRKIHAEEQKQQLAQLASDQLLAKTFAKKQLLLSKEKSAMKYYTEYENKNIMENFGRIGDGKITNYNENSASTCLSVEKNDAKIEFKEADGKKSNVSLITRTRDEKNVNVKKTTFALNKEMNCCQKSLPVHNAVTRTVKHHAVGKYANSGNFTSEPSCSGTQIYGTRSKEELHVPIDILSTKKKILGVEVCVTTSEKDERIGSAESAGSHDSINQEIHHFKPIKPIARTSLKISQDGRPIDPKLIRVIPIVKRVSNAVPKPPSPTHLKRILGCTWSAFRGKARQNLELRRISLNSEPENDTKNLVPQSHQQTNKIIKSQLSETARRLDLAPEMSYDTNKNYAKSINRILNDTRVSKKLILDEATIEIPRIVKTKKVQLSTKNDNATKNKKIIWNENNDNSTSSTPEPCETDETTKVPEIYDDTIVNIAERIKRRRISDNRDKSSFLELDNDPEKRKTRQKRVTSNKNANDDCHRDILRVSPIAKRKRNSRKSSNSLDKRRKATNDEPNFEKHNSNREHNNDSPNLTKFLRDRTRGKKLKATKGKTKNVLANDNPPSSSDSDDLLTLKDDAYVISNKADIDEEIIVEQSRLERLIQQEKKDFELATRLQAQFDDMERIASRTRGSRRAMENVETKKFFDVNNQRPRNDEKKVVKRGNASHELDNDKQRRRTQKQAIK